MLPQPDDLTSPALPGRRRYLAAGTASLACTLGWPGDLLAQGSQGLKLGEPLKLPAMDLLSGGRFSPRDAEGHALVLYWWASWCPFCALQSPHMQALWVAQQSRGLKMLGLSVDRTPDEALAYWRTKGYTFPIAWVTPAIARELPKPRGLPVVVVRGADARVALVEPGQLFPEDIEQLARFMPAAPAR